MIRSRSTSSPVKTHGGSSIGHTTLSFFNGNRTSIYFRIAFNILDVNMTINVDIGRTQCLLF